MRERELVIYECGREKCVAQKEFNYTPKEYHLLHFVTVGKGVFISGNKRYDLHRGAAFYIAPGQAVKYYPDQTSPWSYIWVGFGGSRCEELLAKAALGIETPIGYDNKSSRLKDAFDGLYDSYKQGSEDNLLALGCLYTIFGLFIEGIESDYKLSAAIGHIRDAKEFIANNYEFSISVADVAASVGVTPNYLANIFHDETGMSPKQYLTMYRMAHAKRMLEDTNNKVKNIAVAVGYPNQLHFSAEFKKTTGVSPLTYRNRQKLNKA